MSGEGSGATRGRKVEAPPDPDFSLTRAWSAEPMRRKVKPHADAQCGPTTTSAPTASLTAPHPAPNRRTPALRPRNTRRAHRPKRVG